MTGSELDARRSRYTTCAIQIAWLIGALLVLLIEVWVWHAANGAIGCSSAPGDIGYHALAIFRSTLFGLGVVIPEMFDQWPHRLRPLLRWRLLNIILFLVILHGPPCVSALLGL